MRLLVTGAGGLLGGRLAAELQGLALPDGRRSEVWAARHRAAVPPGLRALDLELGQPASLAAALNKAEPDVVVHAAVLGDADRCEREPELAWAVNALAAGQVAAACHARGLGLVALSTDLVFDDHDEPVDERVTPRPMQAYGRSKLAGEQAVREAHPEAAVVRVSLVCGRGHGPRASASESVLWALDAGQSPRLFVDQWRTPIDALSLARLVSSLGARRLGGLWHAGGPERLSRFELAERCVRLRGLDGAGLRPVRMAELRFTAARPGDVSLDSSRAQRVLGWQALPVDTALASSRCRPDQASSPD
jgi:dTDP-4-dehydrorhamnose reductase